MLSERGIGHIMTDMTNIGIFREGGLPPVTRIFHKLDLIVSRCSFWNIFYWQHDSLLAPFWRFYWNDSPGAEVLFKGRSIKLGPENVVLIPPHTDFASNLNINTPRNDRNFLMGCPVNGRISDTDLKAVRHLFVHFSAGFPYDYIKPSVYSFPADKAAAGQINTIISVLGNNQPSRPYRAGFALHSLLNCFLGMIPEKHWPQNVNDQRIAGTISWIRKNYTDKISNSDLAERINMSTNGFARLFRQEMMFSPKEYIISLRLQRACIMLHETDKTIKEIAENCGFCDRAYFSRMFIKTYKTGPAEFRKNSF